MRNPAIDIKTIFIKNQPRTICSFKISKNRKSVCEGETESIRLPIVTKKSLDNNHALPPYKFTALWYNNEHTKSVQIQ